jgi:hypothetical protein
LLAALVLMMALAGPFLAGQVPTRDDLGAFHLPVRAFYAEQLARGEPFDWMPQLYAGFYLTGEGQAGTYHPWHWLLYRCLPFRAALACEWLSPYPMLLAGTWLFLRRRLHRADAAMVGGLLFAFSGFTLLHFVHPNAVAVTAHLPWLLWAIDIVLVDSNPKRVAAAQAAIALLTGSQILLGYPQYVWFSLLAEGAYAGFTWAASRRAPREDCGVRSTCSDCVGCATSVWPRLIIAKGAGLLLGGVQLLPTLDALLNSSRQTADAAFASWCSLHPMNLVQLVAPYWFTHRVLGGNLWEFSVYVGAVPLMLVAWLAIHRDELGTARPLVRAAGWTAVASLVLAFGEYGQVYRLQQYLPLVGSFRCPCRYLVLFYFSMAVIAAVGFQLLAGQSERCRAERRRTNDLESPKIRSQRRERIEALWAVVFVSVAVALAGLFLQDRPLVAAWPRILAGPLLMAVAAGLVTAAARGVPGALAALVLFAAADLGLYGLSGAVYSESHRLDDYIASVRVPPTVRQAFQPDLRDDVPQNQLLHSNTQPQHVSLERLTYSRVYAPPVEVDGTRLYTGNQMVLAGWQRTDGYTGLEPQRRLDYSRLPALRAASTRWVHRDARIPAGQRLMARDDEWLEVQEPLPRVRLVTRTLTSDNPAQDIEQIDVQRTAICEYPYALPPGKPGCARIVAERPGRLEIAVACRSPQILVVSESFHGGWQCMVDGCARPVLRVNGDFLGCLVQPGEQSVVLEFHPASLARGWLATFAGAGLVLCCFVGGFRRRKPPSPAAPDPVPAGR